LCLGEAGDGAGKRCKWLINKPLESPSPDWKSACRWFGFRPWPPFRSIFQIRKLRQGAWTLCPILAPMSNISVRCSL